MVPTLLAPPSPETATAAILVPDRVGWGNLDHPACRQPRRRDKIATSPSDAATGEAAETRYSSRLISSMELVMLVSPRSWKVLCFVLCRRA